MAAEPAGVSEVGPKRIAAADRVQTAAAVLVAAAFQTHFRADSRLRHGDGFTAAAAGAVAAILEALAAAAVHGLLTDGFHRRSRRCGSSKRSRAVTGHKQTSFQDSHPILCGREQQRSRQKSRCTCAILSGKGGLPWNREFTWTFSLRSIFCWTICCSSPPIFWQSGSLSGAEWQRRLFWEQSAA